MPKNFLPVNRENLRSPGRAPSIAKTLWAVMRPESLICLQEKPFLNHSRRDANLFKDLLRKGVGGEGGGRWVQLGWGGGMGRKGIQL